MPWTETMGWMQLGAGTSTHPSVLADMHAYVGKLFVIHMLLQLLCWGVQGKQDHVK